MTRLSESFFDLLQTFLRWVSYKKYGFPRSALIKVTNLQELVPVLLC